LGDKFWDLVGHICDSAVLTTNSEFLEVEREGRKLLGVFDVSQYPLAPSFTDEFPTENPVLCQIHVFIPQSADSHPLRPDLHR
jgi:hypothetical protein